MTFREFANSNIVILDGAMGSLIESCGNLSKNLPERLNVTHPEIISDIHRAYFDAGSNVVNTNTFGANLLKFNEEELEKIIAAAVENARRAAKISSSGKQKFVSLDIGPTGRLLKPFGDLDFEDAVKIFAHTVKLGVKYGVDLITVETMNDSYETRAALLAVKECTDLPVIVTNAYGEDGKLLSGSSASVMTAILEGMGADYIGANCSLGPDALASVVDELLSVSSLPIVFKPNAGLPEVVDGKTVYNVSADAFSSSVISLVKRGVRMIGGCCGTTPEYIRALSLALEGEKPKALEKKNATIIASYCKTVVFDNNITLIGECINPTGKKRIKLALSENDIDFLVNLGERQEECGADALDVNVGMPGISEPHMLQSVITALQYSVALPLVIDTSDPEAMEAALRIYNGKALINSVNGKQESMNTIFPLVKKYGGAVIALTLDEDGIPNTSERRVEIAKKIIKKAAEYGIDKKDIIFDSLAMTISTDKSGALVTMEAIRRIRYELGCHVSLGVSNISFGLPKRENINSSFFSMAISNGLSAAIMNPLSSVMMKAYYSAKALMGLDDNFSDYIAACETFEDDGGINLQKSKIPDNFNLTLSSAIERGLIGSAASITDKLLAETQPLDIINNEIIPALDKVGRGFEEGKIYLPSLLQSAEASKSAFERIKLTLKGVSGASKGKVVIATVKGDIHDIGKNIVKLLLENYGFCVIDLGKDVPPEKVAEAAKSENADIVALSALMTTTLPAMEKTIKLVREVYPAAKIMVGGAVLTASYAEKIGADAYTKDAMGAVRYAEGIISK